MLAVLDGLFFSVKTLERKERHFLQEIKYYRLRLLVLYMLEIVSDEAILKGFSIGGRVHLI